MGLAYPPMWVNAQFLFDFTSTVSLIKNKQSTKHFQNKKIVEFILGCLHYLKIVIFRDND